MSDLLLDAHTMLWFFWDEPLLSVVAKDLIEDPANRKLVSIASCWEIAVKSSLGKLRLGSDSHNFLAHEVQRNNFEFLPITLEHATYVEHLSFHHKDPFDRLLIAQAMLERIPIISVGTIFDAYGITRLW